MRERKAAEKEAERQRKEAQKQAAEQKRLYEESKLAEAKLLAEQEAAEIARRQEQDAAKAFEEQKLEAERRLREETEAATARLLAEREAYWEEQRQLAVRLLTERITVSISERQKDALAKLRMQEKVRLETIRKMEALLRTATALEHNSNLDRLLEQARTFHSDEEVIAIQADAELGRPAFVKLEAEKRLEILKTQLEVIKSKREKAKAKKEKKANAKKE